MKLLTQTQEQRMRENGAINAALSRKDGKTEDFQPVVKLFCPWTDATWLLTETQSRRPRHRFRPLRSRHGFSRNGERAPVRTRSRDRPRRSEHRT
jgi:hypothetical protein